MATLSAVTDSAAADDARDAATLEVEQGISLLFNATKTRIRALSDLFHADLQPAGFTILRYILAHGPVRGGDVAVAVGMDKSAVSRQLTVLREMELLETRPDPLDGRAALLVATEVAKSALVEFRHSVKAEYFKTLESWDTDEIHTFGRLLQRFNESLD